MNSLKAGTVLHGKSREYKIERMLGDGSFGITYLATTKVQVQGELGTFEAETKVAIKEFFMKDLNGREGTRVTSISTGGKEGLYEKYKSKFIKESQNLSKLKHPNIVKVLENFEANGTAYYAMEYLDGGSLEDRIAKKGGLGEDEAKRLACKIGDALSYMHSRGMLHLDLKPGNIMLRADGTPVVIDFGLSKQYTSDGKAENSTTVGLGTPGYAPIEQGDYQESKGKFPVTMDVYAFGATVFKMLTGNTPPKASEIMNHGFPAYELQDKNVSITTIRAIKKAMAHMVADRCQTVKEFVTLLGEEDTVPDYEGEKQHREYEERRRREQEAQRHQAEEERKKRDEERLEKERLAKERERADGEKKEKQKTRRARIIKGLKYGGIGILSLAFIIYIFIPWILNIEHDTPESSMESVDLGLSVEWATCNVGASEPHERGNCYAWGETSTKMHYTESNSKTLYKNMTDISGDPNYDVASAKWGGGWRMPTKREMEELEDKCTWTWTSQRGVKGFRVTGPNGNSIFLPSARWSYDPSPYFWYIYKNYAFIPPIYYWTSTPIKKDLQYAYILFDYRVDDRFRWKNAFVRPVLDFPAVENSTVEEETVEEEVAVEEVATEEAAQ